MSANNWRICPRCHDQDIKEWDERVRAHSASYGIVTAEEYAAATQELSLARRLRADEETFSEYYEFYMQLVDGVVKVFASYSGRCGKCQLSLDFKDEHNLCESSVPLAV